MIHRIIQSLLWMGCLFCFCSNTNPAQTEATAPNAPPAVVAQAPSTGEETSDEAITFNASRPEEYLDPQTELDQAKKEFLQTEFGQDLQARYLKGELYLGWGQAEINSKPEEPQWGKARIMAYERALLDAENQYISYLNINIQSSKVQEICQNADIEIPDFQRSDLENQDRFDRLIEKVLAVAEGTLDQELKDLGINAEEFKAEPKPQKHAKLRNAIQKQAMKESVGSLTGLIPIKTFEASNTNKEHMFCVCVVASPKNRQFAYDVLHSRGQIKPTENIREPLYSFVTANGDGALINELGIRKVYDDEGYPCLISYGQWSNSAQMQNNTMRRQYRDLASKQARNLADSYIAFFLNSNSVYSSNTDVSEQVEDAYLVHEDNYKEQVDLTQLLDKLHEMTQSRASATITGIQDLHTWYVPHPDYGTEIVGVVRVWSPRGEINARNLKDFKPSAEKEKPKPKKANASGKNDVKTGKKHNDSNDF